MLQLHAKDIYENNAFALALWDGMLHVLIIESLVIGKLKHASLLLILYHAYTNIHLSTVFYRGLQR